MEYYPILNLLIMHAWDLDSYCHNMEPANAHLDWSKMSNRVKRTRRSLHLDGLERKHTLKKHTVTPYTPLKYVMTGFVICIMGVVIRNCLVA